MIQIFTQNLVHPLNNDNGSNAIEYGLIAALVSMVIVVSLTVVAGALNATFTTVAASF